MPISGFTPAMGAVLTQQKLAQAIVTKQVAKSVVISFAAGGSVTLQNATVTQSLPSANGGGTVTITYQACTTPNITGSTTASDDWSAPGA